MVIQGKKIKKNANKKCENENFEKHLKNRFLLMSQGSLNRRIKFLGQKVCLAAIRFLRLNYMGRFCKMFWK